MSGEQTGSNPPQDEQQQQWDDSEGETTDQTWPDDTSESDPIDETDQSEW
jgi:hypothetical protein